MIFPEICLGHLWVIVSFLGHVLLHVSNGPGKALANDQKVIKTNDWKNEEKLTQKKEVELPQSEATKILLNDGHESLTK